MSLIPLLMSRLAARPAFNTVPAGRYDPGAAHRPVAAVIAAACPAALLVAVALSPFGLPPLLAPKPGPTVIQSFPLLPSPPPEPSPEPRQKQVPVVAAPPTSLPPISRNPLDPVVGPMLPIPAAPGPAAVPIGPTIVESIPAAPLVLAKLDPRYAASFQPAYPPFEQRNEIEGSARVRVLVGTDGRVKAVEDVASTSPGFFTETRRRALAKWRFKPAMRGEQAEESWVVMTVRFRLEG